MKFKLTKSGIAEMNFILDQINISRNRRVVESLNAKSIYDINDIITIKDFSDKDTLNLLKYLLKRTFERSEHPGIMFANVEIEN
jgi:hypothetical protein